MEICRVSFSKPLLCSTVTRFHIILVHRTPPLSIELHISRWMKSKGSSFVVHNKYLTPPLTPFASISPLPKLQIDAGEIPPCITKMASPMTETESEKKYPELKHLGFVRLASIYTIVIVSNLYDYAKQNSGPLRSTVGTVEGAVTSLIGPVYERFKGFPDQLLVLVDKEVDTLTYKFDKHAPPLAKETASKLHSLIKKVAQRAQSFVDAAEIEGPCAAAHCAASESKQYALSQAVKIWIILNKYEAVHKVAAMALPTASHWLEKYNNGVEDMREKRYSVFDYFPLFPVEEIAKAFKQGGGEKEENVNGCSTEGAGSDSDSDSGSD